jgi:hypothetical protein
MLREILCSLFGHWRKTTRVITPHVSEWKCRCCKVEFSTLEDSTGDITKPLTDEGRALHDALIKYTKPMEELIGDFSKDNK